MAEDKKDIMYFKIALLGPSEVGKTSLVNQFVNLNFEKYYEPTDKDIREFRKLINISSPEEPQYCLLIIEDIFPTDHEQIEAEDIDNQVNDKKKKYIQILDNQAENIVSKDKHKMFLPKQIYGYVFIYDASTVERQEYTLKSCKDLIEYLSDKERKNNEGIITKKILVGNKIDCLSENQKKQLINNNKTLQSIFEIDDIPHILTSAKENINVQQIFYDITNLIFNDEKIQQKDEDWKKQVGQDDTDNQKKKQNKKNQDDEDDDKVKKDVITKANDADIDSLLEYKGINVDTCSIY